MNFDLGFDPIFAVAEKEALDHSLWSEFKTVWQGTGDLGNRLQRFLRRVC